MIQSPGDPSNILRSRAHRHCRVMDAGSRILRAGAAGHFLISSDGHHQDRALSGLPRASAMWPCAPHPATSAGPPRPPATRRAPRPARWCRSTAVSPRGLPTARPTRSGPAAASPTPGSTTATQPGGWPRPASLEGGHSRSPSPRPAARPLSRPASADGTSHAAGAASMPCDQTGSPGARKPTARNPRIRP